MSSCFHSAQPIVANAVLAALVGVAPVGLVRIHNELCFFPSPRLAETRKLGVVNGQWCVGFGTLPSTGAAELEPLAERLQGPLRAWKSAPSPLHPPSPPSPTLQALMQVPGDAYGEMPIPGRTDGWTWAGSPPKQLQVTDETHMAVPWVIKHRAQ